MKSAFSTCVWNRVLMISFTVLCVTAMSQIFTMVLGCETSNLLFYFFTC